MATPGVKAKTEEQIKADLDGPFLGSQMTTKFRSLTMRLAYLSEDRPEIKYAVKELARRMQKPHELAWTQLKRLGRYLVGKPSAEFARSRPVLAAAKLVQHEWPIMPPRVTPNGS